MKTRQDVLDHFTFHPPVPATRIPVSNVLSIIEGGVLTFVESLYNPAAEQTAWTSDEMGRLHESLDSLIRDVALRIWDELGTVDTFADRDLALDYLWTARSMLHSWVSGLRVGEKLQSDRLPMGVTFLRAAQYAAVGGIMVGSVRRARRAEEGLRNRESTDEAAEGADEPADGGGC